MDNICVNKKQLCSIKKQFLLNKNNSAVLKNNNAENTKILDYVVLGLWNKKQLAKCVIKTNYIEIYCFLNCFLICSDPVAV